MPKRILIIEDDKDILEILDIIFTDAGYDVVLSEDGKKASAISEIKPDVLLLDIRLESGEEDGLGICKKLKANPLTRHLPIILLSAENNLYLLAKGCGADAYVNKPFDIDHLYTQVSQVLARLVIK